MIVALRANAKLTVIGLFSIASEIAPATQTEQLSLHGHALIDADQSRQT